LQHMLRQLVETEKVCTEIDRLDVELAKFPVERERIREGIRRSESTVAESKAELETEELEERRLESQMRVQEELILKLNHQSGQVSSNQAYTALQNELEAAEAAKTDFETNALEHMEAIDRAKSALGLAEEKLAAVEAAAPGQTAEINGRQEGVEKERAEAVALKAKESADVDPKVLKRFEAVRLKKQPAIAVLTEKSCPMCRIVLPRVRLSEVLRLEEVFECTNCKRILVPAKIFPKDEKDE
jgi:predicted  nucleic acid-binding Zn-ribbon protein